MHACMHALYKLTDGEMQYTDANTIDLRPLPASDIHVGILNLSDSSFTSPAALQRVTFSTTTQLPCPPACSMLSVTAQAQAHVQSRHKAQARTTVDTRPESKSRCQKGINTCNVKIEHSTLSVRHPPFPSLRATAPHRAGASQCSVVTSPSFPTSTAAVSSLLCCASRGMHPELSSVICTHPSFSPVGSHRPFLDIFLFARRRF